MNQINKKIRIAIQKRGRLRDPSLEFLKSVGLKFSSGLSEGSQLILGCSNEDIELLFVRNSDIPQYVKAGVADYGILGENVLVEKKCKLSVIRKLGFGKCSLVIAAPYGSEIKTIFDLSEERIATSYLNILKVFLLLVWLHLHQ